MRKLVVLALTLATLLAVVYWSKKQSIEQKNVQKIDPIRQQQQQQQPPQRQPEPQQATFDQAVSEINEGDLKKHMNYLCADGLEGRMSGKKGNRLSAEYVEKQLSGYGMKTKRQRFSISRANPGPKNETGDDWCENIIGWIEGNDSALKEEVMVVGAHMDHIGYGPQWSSARNQGLKIHPGADDNASGTTGLLEIARAHGKMKRQIKRTTIFIAFSGEEMGLIGSRHYCNNPLFPESNPSISKHIFMLNMDMIGRLNSGKTEVGFGDTEQINPDLKGAMQELSAKYPFAREITGSGSGGSDHASFAAKRVPVCILHTGQHAQYHTPQDTVDRINFTGMTKVVKYATELAWLIGQGARPKAYSGNELKTPKLDHGRTPFGEKQ
jgi:hypothetical protein